MGEVNTETINLRALIAENQAETSHVKQTLVDMELERDRLRVKVTAAESRAMNDASQISDLIAARQRDAAELEQLKARVAEAEQAVRTTVDACDAAVFGITHSADTTIRNLTKKLAERCPSCPCAKHRTQIAQGFEALDELDKGQT